MKRGCRVVKRRHGVKIKLIVVLVFFIAIAVAVSVYISKNVNPMIVTISNEKVRALTNDAVSRAVLDVMAKHNSTEYLTIVRDDEKNIKSVEIDSEAVSTLAQEITIDAQKKINDVGQDGIKIPLGSLSGVTLFTGLGPDINIKIYLVGSTRTRITSVFADSGINQTVHRLYLNIGGSVAVAVPGLPSTINTDTQVLMGEMIIVGDVPPTYLNAVNIGDMLDLVVH